VERGVPHTLYMDIKTAGRESDWDAAFTIEEGVRYKGPPREREPSMKEKQANVKKSTPGPTKGLP